MKIYVKKLISIEYNFQENDMWIFMLDMVPVLTYAGTPPSPLVVSPPASVCDDQLIRA
jgi:hypothetical protein